MRWLVDWICNLFAVGRRRRLADEATAFERTLRLKEVEERAVATQTSYENAKRAAHEQTLELVEAVLSRVQTISVSNQDALTEVAKGVQANAEALNTWMGMFSANQGSGDVSVERPSDQYDREMARELDELKKMGYILPGDEDGVAETGRIAATIGNIFSNAPRG